MIRIDQTLTVQGVTVYRDETQRNKFYVLPDQPRFRIDDNGKPVFKFIKYRNPINREGDKKGGGFVIFDAEFVVPEDKLEKVKKDLEDILSQERINSPVELGVFTYTRGTSTLTLLDSGGALVQKIQAAGKPSLFGHNVSVFTAELSPEGAAVIEAAMQGFGGVAQVVYDLYFITKIPAIRGHVWFNARKFYSYWQQVDKSDDHWWNGNSGSMVDTRRETFTSSDSGGVSFHFDWVLPDPDQDTKLKNKIRDWGWSQLEDAAKRLVLTDPTANTETGLPDGVHHVTRDFSNEKTASFDRYFRESDAVEWHIVPQGTLPNITSIPGVKWAEHAVTVDADDPFFKTLNVNVGVNADFKKFGINSIDVHVQYDQGTVHSISDPDFHFTSPDQRGTFASYIENNYWKFKYRYTVHYDGDSKSFDSGLIETDRTALTVDVGDLGVLYVDVTAGSINWDQASRAEVVLQYEDSSAGVDKVEKRYTLTKADPHFTWLHVIHAQRTKPYQYTVHYTLSDGREITTDTYEATSTELYIDDPFYTRAVHIRQLADFNAAVETIFVDVQYNDEANKYQQTTSFALSKSQPFFDWTFPALTGGKGVVSWSGRVKNQDGTSRDLGSTVATSDTIYIDPDPGAAYLEVAIEPAMIDWTKVKLAVVEMSYAGPTEENPNKSVAVKSGTTPGGWKLKIKDKSKTAFTWSATYYFTTGSHTKTEPVTQTDTIVVLDPSVV